VSDQEIQSLTTGKKLLEVCHICSWALARSNDHKYHRWN
jgi:hypothetical protein